MLSAKARQRIRLADHEADACQKFAVGVCAECEAECHPPLDLVVVAELAPSSIAAASVLTSRRHTHTVGYPWAGVVVSTSACFPSCLSLLPRFRLSRFQSSSFLTSLPRYSWKSPQSRRRPSRPASSSQPAYLLRMLSWDLSSRRSGFQLSSTCRGLDESCIVDPVARGGAGG